MKKFISALVLMMIAWASYAQSNSVYKMYRTQNYHNQLRLNTMTGEVYQVQDDAGMWLVCSAITPSSSTPYRYSLYPTRNIWTYILVDLFTGKIWQCQFFVNSDNGQMSVPINREVLSYSCALLFI